MNERKQDIEHFKQYLERRAPGRRTAIDYVSDVRQFAAYCAKPWTEVTMYDLDAFVDQRRQANLGAATIKRRVAGLKVFFAFLAEESGELSWPNPVRFKRHAGKQPKRLPRDLSNEQVQRLWDVVTTPRDRAWFALMLRAGLRASELLDLQFQDLDLGTSRLTVRQGKGQRDRVVYLSAVARQAIEYYLDGFARPPDAPLLTRPDGRPLTYEWLKLHIAAFSRAAGVTHLTAHRLRHTLATRLLNAGMDITRIQKLLGHEHVSTTMIYARVHDATIEADYHQAMSKIEL